MGEARAVLVTGASRGLGLAITAELLRGGFRVIAVARGASEGLNRLAADNPEHLFFEPFDLSDAAGIHHLVSALQERHGRFYGLVNNAGAGRDSILATMHESDIRDVLGVNLAAPVLLCKYVSRGMLLNRCGRIVNISSIAADTGFSGLSVYGASKAGLLGLTRSLARELGKAGITVNAVSPGYLETGMTAGMDEGQLAKLRRRSPFGRFATVEEVAGAVAFLISDAAGGINGANLVVDLGSTA